MTHRIPDGLVSCSVCLYVCSAEECLPGHTSANPAVRADFLFPFSGFRDLYLKIITLHIQMTDLSPCPILLLSSCATYRDGFTTELRICNAPGPFQDLGLILYLQFLDSLAPYII